jgi:hypothetical protein
VCRSESNNELKPNICLPPKDEIDTGRLSGALVARRILRRLAVHSVRLILTTLFCLLMAPYAQGQDPSRSRVIAISELSDTVENEIVRDFLNGLDREIGKLAELYPQLSDWNVERKGDAWLDAGKKRTEASLVYAHSLMKTKSSNYLERYGPEGFYLRVEVLSQRRSVRLEGASIGTVIFGTRLGNGCLFAEVLSAHPKVPELEKRITEIIKKGSSQQPCY